MKKIESHFTELEQGTPSQRTALNLAGISPEEMERGHIIVRKNFFTPAGELIASVRFIDRGGVIKNNMGIEIIIGTTTLKGKMILIDPERKDEPEFSVRLRFERPWHFYPGQPFIITRPGGYRVIGGGTVVLPDALMVREKKRVRELFARSAGIPAGDLPEMIVRAKRSVKESQLLSFFPQSDKALQKIVAALEEKKSVVREGDMLIDAAFHGEAVKTIADAIENSVGLNLAEIAGKTGMDPDIIRLLMPKVALAIPIVEKDGRYFSGSSITVDTLPPDRKKTLAELAASGLEGMELTRIPDEKSKTVMKDLLRLGFAVSLDGNIIYHRDVYEVFKKDK